jgi:iron uptake system component EfeO
VRFAHLPARKVAGAAACGLGALLLAACTENPTEGTAGQTDSGPINVRATDTTCEVNPKTAPSGRLQFVVNNTGTKVTEFYLYAEDGVRIIGEVENIGPGLSRELVLSAAPGNYVTACKPGMSGDGIRGEFTVDDSGDMAGATGQDQALIDKATADYADYVGDQTEELVIKTEQFVTAYKAGRDDEARSLYPRARVHWERIETVAESFGDLDPKVDLREADLEPGQKWTGWHRLEKDLWPARAKGYSPLSMAQRAAYAQDLMVNTNTLHKRTGELTYTADQIANGSRGLLDEVATGKVTGEEEYWSRTDLWDFQANVDGSKVAFDGLRPLLQQKNPALDSQIETQFKELQIMLDKYRVGDGFQTYDQLSKAEIKELSDAVNALAEPISQLAAAVV